MKLLLLLLLTLLASPVGASEADEVIEKLPGIRSKALADTAKLRAGNTPDMVDAAAIIRDRLLPMIVTLESKLEGKSEKEVRTQIERDLEAISRDASIRGHSDRWGGTAVAVDAAWAMVEHLEARASWCVWQLTKDSKTFDFGEWRTRWAPKSEQDADDQLPARADSEAE